MFIILRCGFKFLHKILNDNDLYHLHFSLVFIYLYLLQKFYFLDKMLPWHPLTSRLCLSALQEVYQSLSTPKRISGKKKEAH